MTRGRELVETFLRTLESRNLDAVERLVTDDIEYSNPPSPAHLGRRALIDFLSFNYRRMDRSSCTVHYWAKNERGDVVMNERTSTCTSATRRRVQH